MSDSNYQLLAQQVANNTERLNQIAEQSRTIPELPDQNVLNPSSLLHVSLGGVSQKLEVQKIISDILDYKFNRLISVAGPITVLGNNITIPPAVWVMENVNYQTTTNTVINAPYAATGYTRTDIIVGNKSNQIVRIAGPETEGVSPAPNVPIDTVLITTVSITDSTIGDPDEPVISDVKWGDISGVLADQIDLMRALDLKTENSAGAIQGFALTNNGNGTVNIATGTAFLRSTNDPYAPLVKYTIPERTNVALTDNANNFILVDYNGGTPALTVTTNTATINTETNSIALVVSRVGNTLDWLSLVGQNVDANAKLRIRFLNQEGIRRLNGAAIGFSARYLTLSAGVLASGLIKINSPAFNTNTPDTFTQVYLNGLTWVRATGLNQVNNSQYNNGGTLTNLAVGTPYRTDYVYLLPNNPSKLYVIMGDAQYGSITAARTAPTPSSLPSELQSLGVLVGRLIILRSGNIQEVSSSFEVVFSSSSVPNHNDLSGIQGGAANDYQHLTAAQVAALVYSNNIKTINSNSLIGTGNLETFNRSFAILDDNFEDGTNSDLTLSTGWSLGSDGISISSSGGWGNSALYNKYTTIDRVSTRALVQVITTNSIFSIIRKPVGLNQFGTVAQVDLTAMQLKLYASWDGTTTVPSIASSVAIPFTIVANRKYLVELTKVKAVSVFKFTDETNPANTVSLTYNQETQTISGIGRQWAAPGVMFNSGSIKLKRFTYATNFPNAPKVLITGHSFVEGYALIAEGDVSKTYSNLLYDSLIGNVAIAGRGGEDITTINTRNDIDFFSPTYHLVDIGSNDTVYSTWLSGIQSYIAKITTSGAIPILATIVPRADRQAFINQANDWIRLSGYNYVDFAKSVTVNNDGVTQDSALFNADAVHPNIAGNAKMFTQLRIDAPFLWDGKAQSAVANLDISEIPKTASFTVALSESGKTYVINSASAVVVTFPTAMPAGKWWEFVTIGSGAVSFVAGSSATLISPDSRLKLRTQYSQARIFARASNQGVLGGDIAL